MNAKENPISLTYHIKNKELHSLLPQGWAFFTKSPREFQLSLYSYQERNIEKVNLKNVQASQLFGLNKSNRATHSKLIKIFNEIPDEHWTPIVSLEKIDCNNLNKYNVNKLLINEIPKGEYIMLINKTTPWAWFSKSKYNNLMIESYAIMIIN